MDSVTISDEIIDYVLASVISSRFPEIEAISNEQKEAIIGLVNRKDVFAILPTGHGKSLIFQVLPDICRELSLNGFPFQHNAIVVVVCPLKSLVDSHIRELTNHGITCASLSGDDDDGILSGKYSFVFGSPEQFIQKQKWKNLLQSEVYKKNLFAFVADEAHVVPKWGYDALISKKERIEAFRKCFSRLGELRSLGPQNPTAPMVALTATANKKTQALVSKSLCLRKDCINIYRSPNRKNIYLHKIKVTTIAQGFQWLVDKLLKENILMGKTIVYCKSIKDCGQRFAFFKTQLGDKSFYPENAPKTSDHLLFGMYHHATLPKHQTRVLDAFHEEHGTCNCRLIFATNALGMGINFPDVRRIFHYGPPRGMEELVQEIGRAGRDGKHAEALLLFNGHHLKNADNCVKNYCHSTSRCLRKMMLEEFCNEYNVESYGHDCCYDCHTKCICNGNNGCRIELPSFTLSEPNLNMPEKKKRKVTKDQKALLKELLSDYQLQASSGLHSFLNVETITAFSNCLVKRVLKECKFIFTKEYILYNLPVFKNEHAGDILCMIHDVFEDIEPGKMELSNPNVHVDQGELPFFYDLEYGGIYEDVLDEYDSESDDMLSDEDD